MHPTAPGPPAPETPVEPPPRRDRGDGLSWIVIAFSVLGIFLAGVLFEPPPEEDDAATLAILSLQAKMLTAIAEFYPQLVAEELPKLDLYAATPSVARALAAVNAYVPSDEGADRAMALLERHEAGLEGEARALHGLVQRAVRDPQALDESDRSTLRAEMGWFGDLLVAAGQPQDAPLRRELMQNGLLLLLVMGGLFAAAGAGTLAGLVLLVLGLLRHREGKLAFRFDAEGFDGPVYLQAFAVYMAMMFGAQVLVPLAGGHPLVGLFGVLAASVLGVLWPWLRGASRQAAFRGLGLHRGRGLWREIGAGIVGYVSILPIVAVGFIASISLMATYEALNPPSAESPPELVSHPVVVWIAEGDWIVRLGVLFLASAFAPLFEEIMFRGALFRGLRARRRFLFSAVAMGVIFAVIHPQGILLVPALTGLAVGFALLREWRDSLIAPMVGHALHNGTLVAVMCVAFL